MIRLELGRSGMELILQVTISYVIAADADERISAMNNF